MGDYSRGKESKSRWKERLSVLVLQDRIGQVVGVRVLDSVEHKDLTLIDHAVVILEHSGAFLTSHMFHR
jgi:septum formation topological specificity factor MinE